MKIAQDMTQLVGNTPLVRINKLGHGLGADGRLEVDELEVGEVPSELVEAALVVAARCRGQALARAAAFVQLVEEMPREEQHDVMLHFMEIMAALHRLDAQIALGVQDAALAYRLLEVFGALELPVVDPSASARWWATVAKMRCCSLMEPLPK